MTCRTLTALALAILVAGCHAAKEPTPQSIASDAGASDATDVVPSPATTPASEAPAPHPSASATAAALDLGALDTAALSERRDPDRVLRFYAAALKARDWTAAAKAWGRGSGVTPATLKASYDRPEPPALQIGKGDQEGAAGSLYYEAPVMLRFGSAAPESGSLVLRRVNDVDGATAEQLRWHIERSTIGQGQ